MNMENRELTVTTDIENLETVMSFIEKELQTIECSRKAMMQIGIAIDEIFSNISRYAYQGERGSVSVCVEILPDVPAAAITFSDTGVPFNPLEVKEPNVSGKASERKVGGLGIYIVKKTMDGIRYDYKDGRNILSIMKNVKSSS